MGQAVKYTDNKAVKAFLVLLVVYATAFYAFPQVFLHSVSKIKALTSVNGEITEQTDIVKGGSAGAEPQAKFGGQFWLGQFPASEMIIFRQYCSFTNSAFLALNHVHKSLFCLNCSYTFYG